MSFVKNTAVTGFNFALVKAADGTAITGATVTCKVSKDGGAQATSDHAATELAGGEYTINFDAAEFNATTVGLLFTATGAIPIHFTIKTVVQNVDVANVPANVTQLLGTAWLTPGTAGTPDVNVTTLAAAAIASIWNALTSGMTTAGSIGKKLANWVLGSDSKAMLSTDAQTGVTIPTVTTVTGGATAATQTSILNAVNAITTNVARTAIVVPQFVPLPASGSTTVRVKITLYNLEGVIEDADTNTVTVHASLADGTSEDSNLSSTTATRDSAGQYHVDYTLLSSAAEGGLYIAVTYAVGAVNMAANAVFAVAQADTVTSIAAIKAKTDNLPASPAAVGSAMALTSAYDAAKTASSQTSVSAIATILSGITSLAQWLGLMAGKQAGNSTALTEINATGAAGGGYDPATDSLEAIRDRGDASWLTATSITVAGYAANQDPWSIWKAATPDNAAAAGTNEWRMLIIDADEYTVTTGNPWTLNLMARGTGAPGTGVLLISKGIYDTGDSPISSTTVVVGDVH